MTINKEFSPISLALVYHSEKEQLALLLQDIKQQTFLEVIKEILLIQTPLLEKQYCQKTKEIAISFKKELPLIFLTAPKNHLGSARKQLVEEASSEWIAWTDSDCRLKKDWLETLVKNVKHRTQMNDEKLKKSFKKMNQSLMRGKSSTEIFNFCYKNTLEAKEVVAVGGPNRLPENRLWKKLLNLSLESPIGHGGSPQAFIPDKGILVSHIPTTNGLFLKSAILRAGNFSPQMKSKGEDLELGKRLRKEGELILYPQPLVINNYASSYLQSLKRLFGFGFVQNNNKSFRFYTSLFFLPLFIISCFFMGVFYLMNLAYFLSYPLSLSSDSQWIMGIRLGLQSSSLFLSFYFSTLLGYSVDLCSKKKNLRPLLLIFFWLMQHLSYSAGVWRGFLFGVFKKQQALRKINKV